MIAAPEELDFARRRGFEPTRELRYCAVALPIGENKTDTGAVIKPFDQVEPGEAYAADVAAASDEPSDGEIAAESYVSWIYGVWDDPGLAKDLSVAAYLDGRIVSFALMHRDGERVWSDMTATDPDYRGRGLAHLVKTAALKRAAAAGVKVAYTSNDEANLPMLAVNTRLGYRPIAVRWSCVGPLTPRDGEMRIAQSARNL